MKRDTKSQALAMRWQGASLKEIRKALGVSLSTASLWSREVHLSETAKRALEVKSELGRRKASLTLRLRTEQKLKHAADRVGLIVQKARYVRESLQVLCAMMYWCEGSKTKNDSVLTFTNSDPEHSCRSFCGFYVKHFKWMSRNSGS